MVRRREPRVLLLLFGVADGVCGLLLGRAAAFWTFSVQPEQGGGPPFWSSSQALYSVFLNLDVGCAAAGCRRVPVPEWPCWLAIIRWRVPGSQKEGGGRRAIGQTGNFRFCSRLSLLLAAGWCRNLCRTRIRTAPHCLLSLSHWPIRVPSIPRRPERTVESSVGMQGMVSNCRGTRLEVDVYHTSMVHSTAGDSVRRSSSSWAFAVPSDGSCPWEQRDNHSRTGDPVQVMREGL